MTPSKNAAIIDWWMDNNSGDPDVALFNTNAGITDPTQQAAINYLVTSLKGASLWTKSKAIYPYIGGTASTHKFNLIDPRDLDIAYRLTSAGTITNDSSGVTFNGSTGYFDTHLNANTVFGSSYLSMHNYVRSNWTTGTLMSALDNNYDWSSNNFITNGNSSAGVAVSAGQTVGMISIIRPDASNIQKIYNANPSALLSNNFISNGSGNFNIGRSGSGGGSLYCNAKIQFSAIMDNLTVSECDTLNTIVLNYQTLLSRNVPPNVYFAGDNITYGVGASDNAHRWTTLLSIAKGWTEVNYGVTDTPLEGGAVTPLIANNLYDDRVAKIPIKRINDKYYIISHAVNDCGYNTIDYTIANFKSQYQTIIDLALANGWDTSNIFLQAGFYENGWTTPWGGQVVIPADATRYNLFVQAVSDLASTNRLQFIDQTSVYGAGQTADGINPNDAGHLAIKNYISILIS